MKIPPIPQTGRKPLPVDDSVARAHLKKRSGHDKSDPFVTDPNADIQVLGKLALRRGDINDLFALGDFCALQSVTPDNRLLVYYIGKTLIAYKRAIAQAEHDVDRSSAKRAIETYLRWLFEFAECFPTRRNIAATLWAVAEDDDQPEIRPSFQRKTITMLDLYRQNLTTAKSKSDEKAPKSRTSSPKNDDFTDVDEIEDNESTHADSPPPSLFSDASMTVADSVGILDFQSNVVESQFFSETQAEESAVIEQTSFEGVHEVIVQKPPVSAKTDPERVLESESDDSAIVTTGDYTVGDRIDGRYEVSEVKRGGMGVVYLCYDHENREPVAIKTFQSKYLENERALTRFNHEATIWVRLEKHRHIVQARLVQDIHKRPHIILEYVSGTEELGSDLRSWIEHRKLDLPTTVEYALHIALGMQHATSKVPGLVHRDLKPANILVTHDHIAKVTDFGLVHSVDLADLSTLDDKTSTDDHLLPTDRLTRVGAIVGTAPYMSPEQCQSKDVDMRSDIYSFGCVLFEMLTGRRVFLAKKFNNWVQAHLNEKPQFGVKDKRNIPDQLQTFVMKCLEKNSTYRPKHWGEIVAFLTELYTTITGNEPQVEVTGPALEARELMDKGYSLTALKRYDEAIVAYDQALSLQPDYAWAWARKGRTYRLLEKYDEALVCYDRAIDLLPSYAFAWNGKGIVLERMGRLDEALMCYDTATRYNDKDVWYWFNRANILYDLERYKEAIPLLERALQIDPKHPNSWAKLGQIHRIMKNYPESAKAYEQAIHLDPAYAWAYNGCGLVYKAMGKLQDAVTMFRRATRYMPNEVWHWYNLTDTLVEMNNYEDALQPAQEATRTDPNHAFSWAKLGQVLRHLRKLPESLMAYDRSLALDSDSAWAMNGKGIVLEQLERYEEAFVCYTRAAELKPNDVWHWYNQGNVLALMDRYEESLISLQKALDIHPQHARSWARLGNTLRHLKRWDEALEACQKATKIAPAYAWAWNEQGITLEMMGRYDEAIACFQTASQYAPTETFYLVKQTDVLLALNRTEEAAKLLDEALRIDDRNAQIHAQYAQTLRRLGNFTQALYHYGVALEFEPDLDWAWHGQGLAYSQLGKHEEALYSFRRALDLNADDIWYWYHLADEEYALNKLPQALSSLEIALALNNRHVESWAKRGQILRRMGRHNESLTAFDLAVRLNPNYAWAWSGRGLTLKEMGKKEEALASYERAEIEDPRTIWYYINQVDILLEQERRLDALNVIDRAIKNTIPNASLWARRGQVLRRLKRHDEALEGYAQALAIDPSYAWAWNGKGLCYAALKQWEEARVCYDKALEYEKNDVWYWHNLGEAHYYLEHYPQALQAFEHALTIDPNHQPSLQKLAWVREKLK